MVEVRILNLGEPSPKPTGDYVQVITRKEHEDNPGNIVSDIEHFGLNEDGSTESMSRETKDVGFEEAIEMARAYAEAHSVPIVFAADRTAQNISRS